MSKEVLAQSTPAEENALPFGLDELPPWMKQRFLEEATRKTLVIVAAVARRKHMLRLGAFAGTSLTVLTVPGYRPDGVLPFVVFALAGMLLGIEIIRRDASRLSGALIFMLPLIALCCGLHSLGSIRLIDGSMAGAFSNYFLFLWPLYGAIGQGLAILNERDRSDLLPY